MASRRVPETIIRSIAKLGLNASPLWACIRKKLKCSQLRRQSYDSPQQILVIFHRDIDMRRNSADSHPLFVYVNKNEDK